MFTRTRKATRFTLIAVLSMGLGVGTGTAVSSAIVGNSEQIAQEQRVDIPKAPHEFPENAKGQTYGSALHAPSYEEEPDLIEVIGINGQRGYALKTDLHQGADIKTPEEAVAWEKSKALGKVSFEIPVYDVTGQKVIDTFVMDH